MTRTKKGVKRHGDYVEVVLSSTDGHHCTVSKACSPLGQPLDSLKTAPALVRVSGCKIPDHPLTHPDGESSHPWTIGWYLKQTFASRSTIKLGLLFEEVSAMHAALVSMSLMLWCKHFFMPSLIVRRKVQHKEVSYGGMMHVDVQMKCENSKTQTIHLLDIRSVNSIVVY